MIRIELEYNNGFVWHSDQGVHVKGYVFHSGKYLTGKELATFITQPESPVELSALLSEAAGSFSLIIEREGSVWMASDPLRVFPVFYRQHGKDLCISDSANFLAGKVRPVAMNREAIGEFRTAGFVSGRETLFRDVFQVQPGELAWGNEDEWNSAFYYTYRTGEAFSTQLPQLASETQRVLEETFERLLESVRGRTVAVPLSGGFDSRPS